MDIYSSIFFRTNIWVAACGRCRVEGVESRDWRVALGCAQVAAGPFRLSTGFTTKEEKAKEYLEVFH